MHRRVAAYAKRRNLCWEKLLQMCAQLSLLPAPAQTHAIEPETTDVQRRSFEWVWQSSSTGFRKGDLVQSNFL